MRRVADSGGPDVLIEDFESPNQWAQLPSTSSTPDLYVSLPGAHSGKLGARFVFRQGTSQEQRGIYQAAFLTPIPAIVSNSFLDATGTKVGGTLLLKVGGGTLVPVVLRGSFELFPTTHTRDGAVIIFNRDRLLAWADMAYPGLGGEIVKNELWMRLEPGADPTPIVKAMFKAPFQLERITTRQAQVDAATKNPLIAASGSGILAAAFVAILALVAAALLTSLLAALRRRRVEIAVIRAIGLSSVQVLWMLILEYAFVFVVGVTSGAFLGLFVSSRMLSFLNVTEAGEKVEPGFILETRWPMVAAGVVLVFVMFAIALWVSARTVARNTDAAALRSD